MPRNEFDGLPVIDMDESEKINVAVSRAVIRKTPNNTRSQSPCGARVASTTPA